MHHVVIHILKILQVAALALLFAAIGGSDMSLHANYTCSDLDLEMLGPAISIILSL